MDISWAWLLIILVFLGVMVIIFRYCKDNCGDVSVAGRNEPYYNSSGTTTVNQRTILTSHNEEPGLRTVEQYSYSINLPNSNFSMTSNVNEWSSVRTTATGSSSNDFFFSSPPQRSTLFERSIAATRQFSSDQEASSAPYDEDPPPTFSRQISVSTNDLPPSYEEATRQQTAQGFMNNVHRPRSEGTV